LNRFWRLFEKRKRSKSDDSLVPGIQRSENRGEKEKPHDVDLSSIEYIPLPPSPPVWEVDGRGDFSSEYSDPPHRGILEASGQGKYTKVVKLAESIPKEKLAGSTGQYVAKAYRNIILKRLKSDQVVPAARWAKEMLDAVSVHCSDVDKRRYNRIIKKLDKAAIKHEYTPMAVPPITREPPFLLKSKEDWSLTAAETLQKAERPDTAFLLIAITADGVLYGDRSGKSNLASDGVEALRRYNHTGKIVAERSIGHNSYRIGCNPKGGFYAIMDKDCGLHVYDSNLNTVIEKSLKNDRRVREHFKTLETSYWGELRSLIRAVDVNTDGVTYLFTIADEAWCCSLEGDTIWSARMPLKEGWERAVKRSKRVGTSEQIITALDTLELVLPTTSQEIKQRYRKLALQHHPDHNPGDPFANKHMQRINEAFQLLTGVDPDAIDLDVEESETTYFRRQGPDQVIERDFYRIEITVSVGSPQDMIYAASFSADDSGALLATYSGKVIEVNNIGRPIRAYDLGTVPKEIVDTGGYLYLLTSTRLYVLEQRERLVALIDVFHQGRLLVTTTGFCLLDRKRFQWFTPSGLKIGEISTRDPIRSLYDSDQGTVLETRQHRTTVKGLRLYECRVSM